MGKRYDNVTIRNVVDGSVISGHEAVEAYFERERKLVEEHGTGISFQLYRANLAGKTRSELQGPRISELKVSSGLVSGTDTVGQVKQRLLPAILGDVPAGKYVTFVFGGRVMADDKLFYADHYMMLPSFIQVCLSDVTFEEFMGAYMRAPA